MAEVLGNVDAAWLRMEDPTNLMMVTGILVFEERLDQGASAPSSPSACCPSTAFARRSSSLPLG